MEKELKEYLDELVERFNRPEFVDDDPISVPHRFERREDVEIAGFLSSTIAWGNRKAIVKSARRMIDFMEGEPYRFVMEASDKELDGVRGFVHRTFNGDDFVCFILSLRRIYAQEGGIGGYFEREYARSGDIRTALHGFRKLFFDFEHPLRTEKHLSSIAKGAACKRMNMFIKWMVRKDDCGVDFGLWDAIPSSALYLPLDVHTANMGRAFGLLSRKQNDWKSVEQITAALAELDADDPVKYDFALFGAGIHKVIK